MSLEETKVEYQKYIRKLEVEEFPKLANNDFTVGVIGGYHIFTPNHHFNPYAPLLTEKIVKDLRDNQKKILSVGCGPAYLEQLLTKKFGVKSTQITLADKSKNYVPSNFKFHEFDMYKGWPDFQDSFDYVIFPESTLLNINGFKDKSEIRNNLYHIIKSFLTVINPNGEIRITGHCQDKETVSLVAKRIDRYCPKTDVIYHNSELLTVKKEA